MGILNTCMGAKPKVKGNIIFKAFQLNLPQCKNREVESSIDNVKKALFEAEDIRAILDNNYSAMLDLTGTIVLETPDLVNSVRSFRVSFLIEINKIIIYNQNLDYNQVKKSLNLSTLFKFSLYPPFYIDDKDEIMSIRKFLNFEIETNEKLVAERNIICRYLMSLQKYKDYLQDLYNLISRLIDESNDFISNFFSSKSADEIINAKADESLAKSNLNRLTEDKNTLKKINEELDKLAKEFDEYSLMKYNDPSEFDYLEEIAKRAVMEKKDNLKVVIWDYFSEKKIKIFDDWKNNFCYQEDETEINMNI